jgi:hypothetical protein
MYVEENSHSKVRHHPLRAGANTLVLLAVKGPDGAVVTTVTTRDAEKRATRGMTEQHASMDAAKAHLVKLAEQVTKLGWQRGARGTPKPDAFSKLPAPAKG